MKIAPFLLTVLLLVSCSKKRETGPVGFKIHPDFKIELVASEPLVFDPVEFQFSPSGRAYVLEMPGYPLSDSQSRIVLLKDNNSDGLFDERKVYAENLGVASSFMFYKGGLLVASPPNLIWINDTDHNDEADERIILMDGFSNENLQHNFNGLTYGLDNWIYAANGGNSGNPYFLSKPQSVLNLRGGDLRLDLENEIAQRVGESSGGFKLTFDSWGRLYETHNLEHVSQLVFEDRYFQDIPIYPSHTLTNISDHDENGLSRIYPIGEQETRVNHPEQSGYFSGACGITYYGGGIFPENLESPLLVADCVLNLIHMDLLTQNGSVSKAARNREKVEFLASSDRAFRPVNMSVGPDGALYVVDMHRVVIEHPEWIPDEMEAALDINAGKDQGRIYRVVPISYQYNKSKNLEEATDQELVTALGSKNQWTRKTAQQILVTNNSMQVVPIVIEQLNDSENPLAKLHSIWTLEGLNSLDNNQLKKVLNDTDDRVVENAIKIAEARLGESPEFIEQILDLTTKGNSRIRMQAALSLSTISDALYNSRKDEIASVFRMVLQEIKSDQWNKMAMVFVLSRQAYAFSREELLSGRFTSEDQKAVLTDLVRVIGKERDNQHIADLLSTLQKSDAPRALKASIITSLSEGYAQGQDNMPDNGQKKNILKELIALENTDFVEIIRASGELRLVMGIEASKKINDFIAQAQIDILNNNGSIEDQLEQLQLIGLSDYNQRASLLYKLLDSKRPLVLQRESLKQLWNSNEKEVASRLINMWPSLGPEARKHATDILLYKSYNHDQLLSAMENGTVNLGEFNLDLERRRVMLFSDDEEIRKRAEALFSDSGVVQRKQVIEDMKPALELTGDPLKGKSIFGNLCSACHIYGNSGNEVGPVLTEISRKSKEALVHEILDPNASVDTRYLNYKIVTTDGSIYFGLVSSEKDTELVLKMAGGEEIIIPKKSIEVFMSTGKSLMPEGLEAGINKQQLADLIAFLQQEQ